MKPRCMPVGMISSSRFCSANRSEADGPNGVKRVNELCQATPSLVQLVRRDSGTFRWFMVFFGIRNNGDMHQKAAAYYGTVRDGTITLNPNLGK